MALKSHFLGKLTLAVSLPCSPNIPSLGDSIVTVIARLRLNLLLNCKECLKAVIFVACMISNSGRQHTELMRGFMCIWKNIFPRIYSLWFGMCSMLFKLVGGQIGNFRVFFKNSAWACVFFCTYAILQWLFYLKKEKNNSTKVWLFPNIAFTVDIFLKHLPRHWALQKSLLWSLKLANCRRQWNPTPVLLPEKSHGQRSLVGCSPQGLYESDMTERLPFHFSLSCIGEGNGNPLQCSCLENPRDRGAWWAAVYGVPQSRTRLKRLSSSSSSSVVTRVLNAQLLSLILELVLGAFM